jgi:DNA-binding transcriptional ArsR family regulator
MGRFILSDGVLPLVAERFKALSEPARLSLLSVLQRGERTVNQLVAETGLGQANVSKHLQVLHEHGFVTRRKNGLFVHYMLADRQVMRLCELMSIRIDGDGRGLDSGNGHARRRVLDGGDGADGVG